MPLTARDEDDGDGISLGAACDSANAVGVGVGVGAGVCAGASKSERWRRHHSIDSLGALRDGLTNIMADSRHANSRHPLAPACQPNYVLFLARDALLIDPRADDLWLTSSSYTQPTTYSIARADKKLISNQERLKSLPAMYDAAGLLREGTILAHGIHLTSAEAAAGARAGCGRLALVRPAPPLPGRADRRYATPRRRRPDKPD